MSNLRRPELAKRIADEIKINTGIIALSAYRPLAESEIKGYIDYYAPEAITEFDAITKGMATVFHANHGYEDHSVKNDNIYICSNIRRFKDLYDDIPLYCIAAPSTDLLRRANSDDCFEFFYKNFKVAEGAKIINCTSQIYTTYHQVRALKYAMKYNIEIDTVGYSADLNAPDGMQGKKSKYSNAVNYLQEIKSTIDAMCDFIKDFCIK